MEKYSKFTFGRDAVVEPVTGRTHYWHYSPDITGEANIIMVKVIMPVGGKHDFHRHPKMNEIIYILNGQAEQWIKNKNNILSRGDSIYIDPDIVHATFNVGEEPLEFLAILSPAKGWEAGTIDEFMNEPYSNYK